MDHSKSPALHNAAILALGIDAVYVPLRVPSTRGEAALATVRDWGIRNLNVTMPHKETAWGACTERDAVAEHLRSVNTICVRDDQIIGYSTDGEGVVRSLIELGGRPYGSRVLILGAGATARAAVAALASAGAEVIVAARRPEQAADAATFGPDVTTVAWDQIDGVAADMVVQTTPVGMSGERNSVLDVKHLPEHAIILDAVYARGDSDLVRASVARRLRAVNGLAMLLHQAAASFQLFSGRPAPLEVMRAQIASTQGVDPPTVS